MTSCYEALFDPNIGPDLARQLVVQIFAQAVRDGRANPRRASSNPGAVSHNAEDALFFLNCPQVRQMAEWIDMALPTNITAATLRGDNARSPLRARETRRRKAVQP